MSATVAGNPGDRGELHHNYRLNLAMAEIAPARQY
jgi:hypothetical protein